MYSVVQDSTDMIQPSRGRLYSLVQVAEFPVVRTRLAGQALALHNPRIRGKIIIVRSMGDDMIKLADVSWRQSVRPSATVEGEILAAVIRAPQN